MKNLLKYKLLVATAALGTLVSCNDDEDPTSARGAKSLVSVDQTEFTVEEGDVVNLLLSTDTPLNKTMDFKLELVGGTAGFRDYVINGDANETTDEETTVDDGWGLIGHKVVFPAFSSTHTVEISTIFDLLPEDTEVIKLKLSSMGNSNGVVEATSEIITITVANKTSNDFVAVADWSQTTVNAHGNLVPGEYIDNSGSNPHELCDFDFDLEFWDAGANVVDADYNNCPATLTLPETADDGIYLIVPSFWSAATAATAVPAGEINYKMKVTMAKPGVWVHEVNIDDVWKYSIGGYDDSGDFDNAYQVAGVLIKTGTTYELQDIDGNTLAQGKMANFKMNMAKNHMKKVNKKK